MVVVVHKDGQISLQTTVCIPIELINRARDLNINRSGLLRKALEDEIGRIESEQGRRAVALAARPGEATDSPQEEAISIDPGD